MRVNNAYGLESRVTEAQQYQEGGVCERYKGVQQSIYAAMKGIYGGVGVQSSGCEARVGIYCTKPLSTNLQLHHDMVLADSSACLQGLLINLRNNHV